MGRMICVDVDVDDVLDQAGDEVLEEISDEDLLAEVKRRHLNTVTEVPGKQFVDLNRDEAQRFLCDLLDRGYYTDLDTLLANIRTKCNGRK